MNLIPRLIALSFALTSFNAHAFSPSLDELFEKLKNSKVSFENYGTVCEQVARLQMAEEYPAPQFDVVSGITYVDDIVNGELDLVVLDKKANRAFLVGEVKCSENFQSALNKARSQRARFLGVLKSRSVEFACPDQACVIDPAVFANVKTFVSVSQKGAAKAGFDREIPYTLGEMMELRKRLLACEASNDCSDH